MGFPTKNDHFGVFWGNPPLRETPIAQSLPKKNTAPLFSASPFGLENHIKVHDFKTHFSSCSELQKRWLKQQPFLCCWKTGSKKKRSNIQIKESKRLQPPNVNNTPTVKTMSYCFFNRIRPTQNDSYRQCHNATTSSRHGLPWLPTRVLAVGETLVGRSPNFVNLGGWYFTSNGWLHVTKSNES